LYKVFEWIVELGQRDEELECFSENLKTDIIKNLKIEEFINYLNINKNLREYKIDDLKKNEKAILKKLIFLKDEFLNVFPDNKYILDSYLENELNYNFKKNGKKTTKDYCYEEEDHKSPKLKSKKNEKSISYESSQNKVCSRNSTNDDKNISIIKFENKNKIKMKNR